MAVPEQGDLMLTLLIVNIFTEDQPEEVKGTGVIAKADNETR